MSLLFDEHQAAQIGKQIADALAEHRDPRWSWGRLTNVVVAVIAIVSLIFSVGLNWGRVADNERRLIEVSAREDRLEADQRALTTAIFTQNTDTKVSNEKLENIRLDVADIKRRLDRRP